MSDQEIQIYMEVNYHDHLEQYCIARGSLANSLIGEARKYEGFMIKVIFLHASFGYQND